MEDRKPGDCIEARGGQVEIRTDPDGIGIGIIGVQDRIAVGAVTLVGKRVPTEASGGIRLENIREIAETGVDYISVGRLTQSAPAADINCPRRSVVCPSI